MKMKTKIIITVCIVVVLLFGSIAYFINWAFFDIQRIDGQELLSSVSSPDGHYTVSLYLNNGGATTDYAVLGVLTNSKNQKDKNIYWQYHCSNGKANWKDNKTIIINGIELDVENDVYDYRKK